jgi:hypothetical protein
MLIGTRLRLKPFDVFSVGLTQPLISATFRDLYIPLDDQLTRPFFEVCFVSPVFVDEALKDG